MRQGAVGWPTPGSRDRAGRGVVPQRALLLDEPTSALGVEQQHEVLELIGRIRDSGVAVILVSHQDARCDAGL